MALEIFAQNRTDLVNLMEFSGSPRRHQLAQQVTDMQSQVSDLKLLAADLPRLREVFLGAWAPDTKRLSRHGAVRPSPDGRGEHPSFARRRSGVADHPRRPSPATALR
ncbi:unnamed protein product [Prorocentrum cordatum]|uniref:Uncharacterized protein n=1 Tax=Prorocentrum cordatum TaxID=2364126 RepID=A0ABN9UB34_9DINO|nr:unnamed protein product [Polarella glacialis]